jgi:glucokinase
MQIDKDAVEIRNTSGSTRCAILLDIGGTTVKSCLAVITENNKHAAIKCFQKEILDAEGSAESILTILSHILERKFNEARVRGIDVISIGMSVPGPFDCKHGVSLMRHKLRSIYKINLKEELKIRLNLQEDFPFKFLYDSIAFLLGESFYGAAKNYNRIIGIILGTGIGSAFMVNKKIVFKGRGIPQKGIYCMEYEGGTVEEKIYRKTMIDRYKNIVDSKKIDLDIEDIYYSATNGDPNSRLVFQEFGERLGRVLEPIAREFRAECIVFGGGVSKSYEFFKIPLREHLISVSGLQRVYVSTLGDLSTLFGIATNL